MQITTEKTEKTEKTQESFNLQVCRLLLSLLFFSVDSVFSVVVY